MIILSVFFLTIVFYSCYTGMPLERGPSDNNNTYNVEYLFEHEGCKVYRFYDRGNYVYFTNCAGSASSIKNDSTKMYIQTIGRP